MAAITFTDGSASITSTEYFLASNSTSQTPQTNKCELTVVLDFVNMVAGDQYRIRIYERVDGGTGTQQVVYESQISGVQSQLVTLPVIVVGDNWEVSLKRISASSRTINWSLRQVNADGANAVNVSSFTASAITSSAIANAALTNAKFGVAAIDNSVLAAQAISYATLDSTFATAFGVVRRAVATAGGASTITLDAGASAVDSFYKNTEIYIVSGTGVGQTRGYLSYVGGTKVYTVDSAWSTNPDNTSQFVIRATISSLASALATAQTAITDLQNRTPAALVSGRMDSSTGAMAANVLTATAINAGAITAAKFATDAIDANALKADAVTEIQTGLGTSANQTLILNAVSNIAVTGAALNATTGTQVVTTGSDAGGVANTTQADGTYDSVSDTAGTLEFYYEFDISGTSGAVGVGVDWLGYVVGLVNTIKVFARNWGGSSWDQIGSIVGISGTANMSEAWELTSAHTSAGLVRIRFQATGLTAATVKTDRILLGYAVVPPTVAAIQSGLATAAALTTVQNDTDDIQTRLPAALVGGRMDSSTGAMAANVVTATAINAAAITAGKFATDAIDANALKADAVAEIQSGLAVSATALSTAQWTNARAALLDNADAEISTRAPSATALSTAQWTNALATALAALPAAVAALPQTVGAIADAVFNYTIEAAPAGATTFIQRLRVKWSVFAAKGLGIPVAVDVTEHYRDAADTKDRATFALNAAGSSRTPGTFDGT